MNIKNEGYRDQWIKNTLSSLPRGLSILDAGAGECQYKKYCKHLKYTSQDFAKYDGRGNERGLQTRRWNNSRIDVVSDITKIPIKSKSFDVILCTEVFERITNPINAISEFARLLKSNGLLIITAPSASLTHFAPYYYYSGFSEYFFREILSKKGFIVEEITTNGNYFDWLIQELNRLSSIGNLYASTGINTFNRFVLRCVIGLLEKMSSRDRGSYELICFGRHVVARKK